MLIAAVLFLIASVYMFNAEPSRKYSSIYLQTWGLLGGGFSTLSSIYIFIKLFDNKPGLIIDEDGLWNNSSIISTHKVKWNELSSIRLKTVRSEKILFLYFKDDESFIAKFNRIERFIMRLSISWFNSPIGISTRSLKYDIHKLDKELKKRIRQN